ncbi:MAG: hypothetical protein IPI00_07870 [Flavobacteriales bacterium]|nr:hypothetical protein [Flavobacteriales bacterium]MBK6943871.1 hypothetical protein [Flavobacteriales bacterium]MBK7240082.1 hypothetical protein [Flavobacteriales bacterium]MBK9535596.1 hypothetical protein [Flavobacteriales bacterium]MBP9136837.1 hypothetical protein [Flavobacteriales bacterium]
MKNSSILIFCAIILSTSCRKEHGIEDPAGSGPSPVQTTINVGDTITFGLVDNMLINGDSVVLEPMINQSVTHDMDVDADGITDFQIFLQTNFSMGGGFQAYSVLTSQHANATLRSFQRSDTSFVHDDTVSVSMIHRVYSCRRLALVDQISSIVPNVTKILWFHTDYMLTSEDAFYADAIQLRRTNSGVSTPNYEPPYQIVSETINDCFLLPLGEVLYIGFAMVDGNGSERLGWWKLNHVTASRIVIYEQAIQVP